MRQSCASADLASIVTSVKCFEGGVVNRSGSRRSSRCAVSEGRGGGVSGTSSLSSFAIWAGVVWKMLPASQLMRVRGDLCRAAPPLAECLMAS